MADVLTDTLTVTVGEDEFVFAIPTPIQQVQVGVRAAAIRRRFDPTGGGWEDGLDGAAYLLVRGMATMEVLLRRSSAKWPYSEGRDVNNKPEVRVDLDKLPPMASPIIVQVYQGFSEALGRFYTGGAGDNQHTGQKDVASEPNPG